MTKNEKLQQTWHDYETQLDHLPTSTKQVVSWAVANGLLSLPEIDPYELLAEQMAQALRSETRVDRLGRRYRVNHAVRITSSGVQYTFWGTLGFAPHDHMQKAFSQRREQIVGDCLQLKTDVDVYNDLNIGKSPTIQLVLDFQDDVAEREIGRKAA